MFKKIISNSIVWIIGGIFLGFLIGLMVASGGQGETPDPHAEHTDMAEMATVWTCSMHPQVRQNEPGSCPLCGMDLIPADQLGGSPIILEMTEEAIKLGNIETTPVLLTQPEKNIYLQGKVKADERRVSLISSRFGGRIEKLFIDFTGMEVVKGQKLASIYSPELITAQQELFEAIKFKEDNPILYKSARAKLKLWNISEKQIDAIEQKGEPQIYLNVLSPGSGIVTKRHISLGEYVKEGTPLFEVLDLSKVWVLFDGYESDLPWLKVGDKIDYTLAGRPGKRYSGRISFIDPIVNPLTRTVSIRVEASNPGRKLKPEMFANGQVNASLPIKEARLIVPKTAVLWTGTRGVVYVKMENAHKPSFQFREIELGPDLGTHFIVNSGLEEGEIVVSNGTFKIDAASQLAGKRSMMNSGSSASSGSIHVPVSFQQQLNLLFSSYTKLKNAFVQSDPVKVSAEAKETQASLGKVEMHLLDKKAHEAWMGFQKTMKKALEEMENLDEIEAQRAQFIPLSEGMANSIESFGLHGKTAYKDFCPMADDNKGAIWISEFQEIKNPYFGEKMMKCGSVKQVFENSTNQAGPAKKVGHNH